LCSLPPCALPSADIDLSSIAQHYKRKAAAVYKEHFIALDRKESMVRSICWGGAQL